MIPASLRGFIDWMDSFDERIPLATLVERLRRANVCYDDVRSVARFGSDRYQRNLLHAGPGYHALVLCWRSGQRSPIHDHRGSSCAVKVLRGVATETVFDRAPNGMYFPTKTRTLAEGELCGSQDADVHQVSNLQPAGVDLVTLHIYSPPLLTMRMYSLTDTCISEYEDPVFELADGGGI